MKLYIATRSQSWKDARFFMGVARDSGHEITFDWTIGVEEYYAKGGEHIHRIDDDRNINHDVVRQAAMDDQEGVRECDVFILLWRPGIYGAMVELGMALEAGKVCFVVGPEQIQFSVFFALNSIRRITEDELFRWLAYGTQPAPRNI